jgi:hypothetical protein
MFSCVEYYILSLGEHFQTFRSTAVPHSRLSSSSAAWPTLKLKTFDPSKSCVLCTDRPSDTGLQSWYTYFKLNSPIKIICSFRNMTPGSKMEQSSAKTRHSVCVLTLEMFRCQVEFFSKVFSEHNLKFPHSLFNLTFILLMWNIW